MVGLAAVALLALGVNHAEIRPRPVASSRAGQFFDADSHIDAIFHRACANCHSNETKWPWYGQAPLIGWLIQHDVNRGRIKLNLSTGTLGTNEKEEILDAVSDRSMPPRLYLWMHPGSQLSADDLAALQSWAFTRKR